MDERLWDPFINRLLARLDRNDLCGLVFMLAKNHLITMNFSYFKCYCVLASREQQENNILKVLTPVNSLTCYLSIGS